MFACVGEIIYIDPSETVHRLNYCNDTVSTLMCSVKWSGVVIMYSKLE
jgi:hypothetical protein